MPRYRTRSWRSFDPQSFAARATLPAAQAAARLTILGIDPGSRRTGYGVIECHQEGYTHVAHGCLNVASVDIALRLRRIFEGLGALIAEHRPAEVAVERVFVKRNVLAALKLGQARGAALCAVPPGTPVFEYAPSAIKLALAGSGAAAKPQVAHVMKALLCLTEVRSLDASDALAVALCHAHHRVLAGLAGRAAP